jgi:hypothetical protein
MMHVYYVDLPYILRQCIIIYLIAITLLMVSLLSYKVTLAIPCCHG